MNIGRTTVLWFMTCFPTFLGQYDPINIHVYHVSALWAFWVTWYKHFYDPDPVEDWKVDILTKLKEQFYQRIAEAPSMTQWSGSN